MLSVSIIPIDVFVSHLFIHLMRRNILYLFIMIKRWIILIVRVYIYSNRLLFNIEQYQKKNAWKRKRNYLCYRNHWLFLLSSSRETRVFITRSHFGSFFLTSEWRVRTLYGQAFKCSDTFAFASNIHSLIGVIAVLKNHCWNVRITGYSSSPKIIIQISLWYISLLSYPVSNFPMLFSILYQSSPTQRNTATGVQ